MCTHKIWMLKVFQGCKNLISAKFCESTPLKITENLFPPFMEIYWKTLWFLNSSMTTKIWQRPAADVSVSRKFWSIVKDRSPNWCPDKVRRAQVFPFPDNFSSKRNGLLRCTAWKQSKSRGNKKVKHCFQSLAYQRLSACLMSDIYTSDFSPWWLPSSPDYTYQVWTQNLRFPSM